MSTPASRYGPYDPTTAPTHGRRFGPNHRHGKRKDVELIPLTPIHLRQREQINRNARGEPLTPLRPELCAICSKPERECLSIRPGSNDDHEYEPPRRRVR